MEYNCLLSKDALPKIRSLIFFPNPFFSVSYSFEYRSLCGDLSVVDWQAQTKTAEDYETADQLAKISFVIEYYFLFGI